MTSFLLTVSVAMYEGEGDTVANLVEDAAAQAAAAQAVGAQATAAQVAAAQGVKPKVFSQDDINKFLAEDRRKHSQKYEALEAAYKEALNNQTLTSDQRKALEQKLEDVQKTFRSKEQQLEHEKKQIEERYAKDTKDLQERSVMWESRYRQSLLDRELQDAASVNDAFNASQIVALLKPMTQIVEEQDEQGKSTGKFSVVIDLQDVDTKTGEQIITRRTPTDAVKRMRELPQLFGNLFRANVVSGVGSGSATGSGVSGNGRVDVRNLSPEQYMQLRKSNPAAIGLR